MRLTGYLSESVVKYYNREIFAAVIDARKEIRRFSNAPLVWRGFAAKHSGPIVKVVNDRSAFRGAIEPKTVEVLNALGVRAPVFCTTKKEKTHLFGIPYIFIPLDSFRALSSSKVDDLLVAVKQPNADAHAIARTYKTTNTIIDFQSEHEVIFDVREYYLIAIYNITKHNPFLQRRLPNFRLTTYKDLETALGFWIRYIEWAHKRTPKPDPTGGLGGPI